MLDELSLVKLNPEQASTKQKIIDLLSNEYPLTVKRIHSKLQRLYSAEISYQGVHKTLKELEQEKVITKKTNEYLLNVGWIQKSKQVLEKIEQKYLQNEKIILPEDFSGSIEIEFDSITDLCVLTTDLLSSNKLSDSTDKPELICTLEYGWWPLKFKFEHLELLSKMVTANPVVKNIIRTKTLFGKWIREQYIKSGKQNAPLGTKTGINEDLMIKGNYIIEVKYDKETKKIIQHYYNKWKTLDDCYKEFGLKPEPKTHAVMRITRNPILAEYLRKQLNNFFEN